MPKLDVPNELTNGQIQIKCKDNVEHNESVLMVPHDMLISVKKTLANKSLKNIIMQHPEAFSEERESYPDSYYLMILVLSVLYEISLGDKSKFAPYVQHLKKYKFTEWNEEDLNKLQDASVIEMIRHHNSKLQDEWEFFEAIMLVHFDIFPKDMQNKELFVNIY